MNKQPGKEGEQPEEPDWIDEDELIGGDICPNCGHEYDEIDYEYRICHICGYVNKYL